MKQRVQALLLIGMVLGGKLQAQEIIYRANGNRYSGKLISIDGEKLRISASQGNGKTTTYSVRREHILLVFKPNGAYRLIQDFDTDSLKAQAQIEEFDKAPAPALAYDLLLRANPATVLVGTIGYESPQPEGVVNFKTPPGKSASINKRELAAIFYRNGRHQLFQTAAEVTTAINRTRKDLLPWYRPVAKAPIPKTLVKAKAVNVPAKVAVQVKKKPATHALLIKKATVAPPPVAPPAVAVKPTLNDEELLEYRTSSLNRVEEFSVYLKFIVGENNSDEEKNQAIKAALGMFTPEATIEVSSINKPGTRTYKVADYLRNLKNLPYKKTSIEWNEIQYVSELKQSDDGKYYGTISAQQTFNATDENGSTAYSDVTEKNVRVILDSYTKIKDDKPEVKWNVLLGNIGISVK